MRKTLLIGACAFALGVGTTTYVFQAARAAAMYTIMVPDLLPPDGQHVQVCTSLHEVRLWLELNLKNEANQTL